MQEHITPFRTALEAFDRINADAIIHRALLNASPIEAVEQVVVPALEQIGEAWNAGQVALSQVYMSGRFCEELVDRMLPPSDPDRKHQPRSAIVVLSDYHDLGKRIVYSVMRASGFELFDYGRMDVDALVARTIEDRVRVLMISVLMLPSALKVRDVCHQLRLQGADTKVIVGGAPFLFDSELWKEVGADAMGSSSAQAVSIVEHMMGEMQ
jgi:methanogenic corrinoid protein MtbC1